MKLVIASDHGGFELKEEIKKHLAEYSGKIAVDETGADSEKIEVTDLGTDSEESCDYPQFGIAAGEAVAGGADGSPATADRGIVVCGSGIGISIAANKVSGVRCALCTSAEMATLSRQHNNSNMLALGGRILDKETAFAIVDAWLSTDFEGGRHQRRIDQIGAYDRSK